MSWPEKIVGVHHFNLTVVDVDRSVDFYTRLLGFELRSLGSYEWGPDYGSALVGAHHAVSPTRGISARIAIVDLNGTWLELIQMIEPKTAPFLGDVTVAGSAHIAIKVRNIGKICERLQAAGVEFIWRIEPLTLAGAAHAHLWCPIRDPDGITVELVEETPIPTLMETLGLRIREARSVRRLTLKELSAICDVSAAHLSQVERGDAFPSIPALMSISSALSVPPDHFLRMIAEAEDSLSTFRGEPASADVGAITAEAERVARIANIDDSQSRSVTGGVQWRWLTGAQESIRILQGRYDVGSASEDFGVDQRGTEVVVVLEGILAVELGSVVHTLGAGSSITFNRSTRRRFSNAGSIPAVAHWIVAPSQPFI